MIKEVTKGKVYWKTTSKYEVEDLETIQTFYSPLASWVSPYFLGLDLARVGLAHIFKPQSSHSLASPFFSSFVFNHIVGLIDLINQLN
jgi:hypothetical protein